MEIGPYPVKQNSGGFRKFPVTFIVDKQLMAPCLGLRRKFFVGAGDFSSEKRFSRPADEMHKYFLDGKIVRHAGKAAGKYFSKKSGAEYFGEGNAGAQWMQAALPLWTGGGGVPSPRRYPHGSVCRAG